MERGPGGDRVARAWAGRTVVCLASGPSVTQEQVELIRVARERDAVRVIVTNDMYLVAPWADLCYFADRKWWNWHTAGLAKKWPWVSFTAEQVRAAWAAFGGQKVTILHVDTAPDPALFVLGNGGVDGISDDAAAIRTGQNSGFQALNVAVLSGGNPILLVGYDMGHDGQRTHSHNGHQRNDSTVVYRKYAQMFTTTERPLAALGVRVLNCTTKSDLTAFPQADLARVLADPARPLV